MYEECDSNHVYLKWIVALPSKGGGIVYWSILWEPKVMCIWQWLGFKPQPQLVYLYYSELDSFFIGKLLQTLSTCYRRQLSSHNSVTSDKLLLLWEMKHCFMEKNWQKQYFWVRLLTLSNNIKKLARTLLGDNFKLWNIQIISYTE